MGLEQEIEWTLKRYNTNMDPEMELTPHHLRWDIYGNGPRIRVDPQKGQHKYRSRDGFDNPQNLTSLYYSYGDKNLRWKYLQKCIINTSATYIWHTCEKFIKNGIHSRKWNWPIIVSMNTYQFHLWRNL